MIISFNRRKLYVAALFAAIAFTFTGYYVLLILITNLAGNQYSRYVTIPIRILIILLLFACIALRGKKKYYYQPILWAFGLFSIFYLFRIVLEIMNNVENTMSNQSFILYFLGFGVFPFFLIYLKKNYPVDLKIYKLAVLIPGVIVSILTIIFYKDYIGSAGRINLILTRSSDDYISPLHLSDTSALVIGVSIFILLTNATTKFQKLLLISAFLLACVPFFLGAGRSSILAILVPFFFFLIFNKNKSQSFFVLIGVIGFTFLVVFLSELFGSSVISRFMSIDSAIENGSSAAVRAVIWEYSLAHFYDHPLFGFSLEVPETGHHSHNIFIEVLLNTGFLGFLPFLYLVIRGFKSSITIIKYNPESSWLVVVFFQSLMTTLFHGTIYKGSWFWFSLAFILSMGRNYPGSFPKSLKRKKEKELISK